MRASSAVLILNEFVKAAVFVWIVKEREIAFVKFAKEFVPN